MPLERSEVLHHWTSRQEKPLHLKSVWIPLLAGLLFFISFPAGGGMIPLSRAENSFFVKKENPQAKIPVYLILQVVHLPEVTDPEYRDFRAFLMRAGYEEITRRNLPPAKGICDTKVFDDFPLTCDGDPAQSVSYESISVIQGFSMQPPSREDLLDEVASFFYTLYGLQNA